MRQIRRAITTAAAVGLLALLPIAHANAQSLNALGLQRLNQDAQALWAQDGLPLARQAARQELQKLVGIPHRVNKKTTATITKIGTIVLDCPSAPGLSRLDGSRIEGRLPRTGVWRVAASVDVHIKGKILLIPIDRTYQVAVEVKDVAARVRLDLDSSDPSAPRVAHVYPPTVTFKLKITTSSWVLNLLSWLTRPTVNGVANALANVGLRYLTRTMNLQIQNTPAVQGAAGGPGLAPVRVSPRGLERAAMRLEDDLERWKRPFGTVFNVHFDTAYQGTWGQSVSQPLAQLGRMDFATSIGDSALQTGQYLAALAFRYKTTHASQAVARARDVLRATRTLLTMKGRPGDLNRNIFPYNPGQPGPAFTGPTTYIQAYQGVDYIMADYVSRDAYLGIFFGTSLAYDLFDDPQIKQEAAAQIEMALDYLLAHNWTWRKRDGSFGERWQGVLEQQYGWILAGWRVNPAKYATWRESYKGYTDILWTGFWIAMMDPYYSYYKFNLESEAIYTLLRLETDPVRWQRAYQAIAIQRHFIGHHQNAHFNNIYAALDPSLRPALEAENANLLTRWLRHPRRNTIVDLRGDTSIERSTYTLAIDANLLFPGSQTPKSVEIAKYPVPVEKRLSGDLWTRSPFAIQHSYPAGGPDYWQETDSVDYLLPYWMARYHRVVPAPRPRPRPRPTTTAAMAPGPRARPRVGRSPVTVRRTPTRSAPTPRAPRPLSTAVRRP